MQPQHYYGPNFGYIVAFRPYDNKEWRKVMVAEPQARSYIHKDLTFPPLTKFQVKVKAFNSRGEGPFSLTAVIYSAQDGESSTHSQLFCTRRQHTLTSGPPRPLSPQLGWILQHAAALPVNPVSVAPHRHCRCSRIYFTGISHVQFRGILIPLENVAIFPGADYPDLRSTDQGAQNSPRDAKHLAHLLAFTDRQSR